MQVRPTLQTTMVVPMEDFRKYGGKRSGKCGLLCLQVTGDSCCLVACAEGQLGRCLVSMARSSVFGVASSPCLACCVLPAQLCPDFCVVLCCVVLCCSDG